MMQFRLILSLVLGFFCFTSALAQEKPPWAFAGAEETGIRVLKNCATPEGVSGSVSLEPGCRYSSTLVLAVSDTHLNCRGATFSGFGDRAIIIRPGLKNVTVRNCRLFDTGGLLIEAHDLVDAGADRAAARAASSSGIVISQMTIDRSRMTGIFVDHFVTGATIENSVIQNGATVGVYLEYGSQSTRVRGNVIRGNGFIANNGVPRLGPTRREGLSIDGSAFNLIEGNLFERNAFGGVFLYKNCQEYHSTQPASLPRLQGADNNTLRGNLFRDMPMGVWIAARQARDLTTWDCGDASPYGNPVPLSALSGRKGAASDSLLSHRFNVEFLSGLFSSQVDKVGMPLRSGVSIYLDHAKGNLVEANSFKRLGTGVRVEDDNNRIAANLFEGAFDYVYVGTPFRSRLLGLPVSGTRIENNRARAIGSKRFSARLVLVEGENRDTAISGNGPCATPGKWPASGKPRSAC